MAERTPASVDKDELFTDFIKHKKSGFCFQNIELLSAILNDCGFSFTRHLAKVINKPVNEITAEEANNLVFSHEALVVQIAEQRYFFNTAFANNSLRFPLPIDFKEHTDHDEIFRFTKQHTRWQL